MNPIHIQVLIALIPTLFVAAGVGLLMVDEEYGHKMLTTLRVTLGVCMFFSFALALVTFVLLTLPRMAVLLAFLDI